MTKINYVNEQFKSLVLPVVPFEVTDKLPQHLRVILSYQIREVFKLRNAYSNIALQQSSLDKLLDDWWSNHWTMIKSASKKAEWSWNDLALIHDKQVQTPPQFVKALRDIRYFIRGCIFNYCKTTRLDDIPLLTLSDKSFYIEELVYIVEEVYETLIFEGLSHKSTKHTSYVTVETINNCKAFYTEHNPLEDAQVNGRNIRCPKFKTIFKEGIGKLPEVLFKNRDKYDEFLDLLADNKNVFIAELYKYLGCCQTTTLSGKDSGPAKSTIINKLLTLYFSFIIAKLSCLDLELDEVENHRTLISLIPTVDFNKAFKAFKNLNTLSWVSNEEFKVRSESIQGYRLVSKGTYNQMFTRIMTEVSGSTSTESFVVSYHPCDLITVSFGYNWSSCQSFIDKLDSFPANYGRAGSGTSNYSGCYHAGNFHFMTGNGYVVYIPYKKEYPLFLTAKLKRMIMWTSNNLNSMRQNYFYPGKPTDSDSIAFASSIRAYLQNVYANENGTTGTADWIAYSNTRNAPFCFGRNPRACFYGYDDPIYKVSSVKNCTKDKTIIYNGNVPILNSSYLLNRDNILGNSTFHDCSGSNIFAVRGNPLKDKVHYLKALSSTNDSVSTASYETITINDDLVVTLDWYVQNAKHLKYVQDKLLFNSKKYKAASGFKYTLELPSNVKACKHCGQFFEEDLLVEGYCMDCAISNTELSITKIKESFLNKVVALSFTSESLRLFFNLFTDTSITWKSGKRLLDFIPQPKDNVLVLEGNCVVLKSKVKNSLPVVELETTMKGGEQ